MVAVAGCTVNKKQAGVKREEWGNKKGDMQKENEGNTMGVHVFRSPRGGLDIFRVATVKAHAVGRTVGGLVNMVLVVSSYGRRIDLVGGKETRPGLGGHGEAGRALGVAANDLLPGHFC